MDAYAELGLERRLTPGDDAVRAAFREVGKSAHPDGGGSAEAFERAQEAERILLGPARRLSHWLELEGVGGDLRGSLSSELMDAFAALGELLQRADALLREREAASSALSRAMLEGRVQSCRDELEAMQERLERMVEARVGTFDEIERGERDGWRVARELVFLAKWRGQVRERFAGMW